MVGRLACRVKARGAASGVPVIYCKAGQRKRRIAGSTWPPNGWAPGVFLVLRRRGRPRCGR